MECIRCSLDVEISHHQNIHDECLVVWQRFHDHLVFEIFPSIFSDKRLDRAQGLAIECLKCYRLAVPRDIWMELPTSLKVDIRSYDTSYRQPICHSCRKIKYRRNADTQLRQAERNFMQEPTREYWATWLREAARVGSFPFTSEGVAVAIGGTVTSFQMTEDGFEATFIEAKFPALEVSYQIAPDDWDSFPRSDLPFAGKIWVQWRTDSDDDPNLYLEIQKQNFALEDWSLSASTYAGEDGTPWLRTVNIEGGEYHYTGSSVQNDEQLHYACHDPAEWEAI